MTDENQELLKWSIEGWPGTDLVRLTNDRGGDITLRLGTLNAAAVEEYACGGGHVDDPKWTHFSVNGRGYHYDIEDAPGFPMLRALRHRWTAFIAGRGTAFECAKPMEAAQ